MVNNFLSLSQLILIQSRGGQAKICGTYADLVGTENAGVQIFSMVLQIFSMMHLGKIFLIEMLLECSY